MNTRRTPALRLLACLALGALLLATGGPKPARGARLAVCFAPGTPIEVVDGVKAQVAEFRAADDARWSRTATDGFIGGRGEPTRLTWSIVPDGTPIPGYIGESAAPSNLRSWLNARYGSESQWLPLFQDVFDRWGEVSGVTYEYESRDDGGTLGDRAGSLGVRGDIRIGGHRIDGNSGTLAYNFFPDDGDMVIDTTDSYFANTTNDSRRLRAVVAHEHGHGLGLDHVCPVNGTKLMEPTASGSVDGPRLDDILASQRLYGDRLESGAGTDVPTQLGELTIGDTVLDEISIDGDDDVDLFGFTLPDGAILDVTLSPSGMSYLESAQNANGSCRPAASFDAPARVDLRLDVLRPDMVSTLAAADFAPAGGTEELVGLSTAEDGTHLVRVRGSGEDEVQLYELTLTVLARTDRPTAIADEIDTVEDVPVSLDLLVNDVGLGDSNARIRVLAQPANGRVIPRAGGVVRYVPDRDFDGADAFTYQLEDGDGNTSAALVTIDVEEAANAGAARIDTDSDLYPDELETLVGSSPTNAASRPATAPPQALTATKSNANVRFNKTGKDTLLLRGVLPVAPTFVREGAAVSFYVGGTFRTFTLDAKGRAKLGRDVLRVGKPKEAGVAFQLRLRKADLGADWVDEGFVQESGVKKEYRELALFVIVRDTGFATPLPLALTIKGKRGKTKLLAE